MEKPKSDLPPRLCKTMLEAREHLFVLLIALLGYNVTQAYLTAINPNIKRKSAQVLGSHLIREERIQDGIRKLAAQYPRGCTFFADNCLILFEQ